MAQTRCIDCRSMGRQSTRPAYNPGPRCEEHWRAERRRRSNAAHANRIAATYHITGEQYWAIYEAQGGRCAICQRGKGKSKRLAVDHDHKKGCGHDPKMGCPKCIRALLCTVCNDLIGKLDVPALLRAIDVLEHAPAQKVLVSLSIDSQRS